MGAKAMTTQPPADSGREHMTSTPEDALKLAPIYTAITAWIAQNIAPSAHPGPYAVQALTDTIASRLLSPAIAPERLAEIRERADAVAKDYADGTAWGALVIEFGRDAIDDRAELLSALTASQATRTPGTVEVCALCGGSLPIPSGACWRAGAAFPAKPCPLKQS